MKDKFRNIDVMPSNITSRLIRLHVYGHRLRDEIT